MEIVIPWFLCSLGVLVGYVVEVEEPIIGLLIISISSIMWILFVIATTKLL